MSFSKDKCNVLHLERSNFKQQHKLGADDAERDLGLVTGSKLNRSQWGALSGKVTSSLLGRTCKSTVGKSRNMAISVYLALTGPHLEYCD